MYSTEQNTEADLITPQYFTRTPLYCVLYNIYGNYVIRLSCSNFIDCEGGAREYSSSGGLVPPHVRKYLY